MKRLSLAATFCLFASPSLLANTPAMQLWDEDVPQERYTTVASFDLQIPNSGAEYVLEFEQALEGGHYSIWYESDPRCRGISVMNVRFSADHADDTVWQDAIANPYEGTYHFAAVSGTVAMSVHLSGERFLDSHCRVLVRKANFEVPTLVTTVARLGSDCIPDSELQECSFWAERLDRSSNDVITVTPEDVARFRLQADSIYKLQGYIIEGESGPVFDLLSAELIM